MIYITGDIHCPIDVSKLNRKRFVEQKKLTKQDYVIICGDVGLVWDNSSSDIWWQKWFENKKFTTLFVDGNHENHDKLDEYPIEIWNGGKIHRIQPTVIHLMRGQVYNIDGMKFFTMGGASSNDKEYRKEGLSWWSRELPSKEEYEEAINNLSNVDWNVNYVVTHTIFNDMQNILNKNYMQDELTRFLSLIEEKLDFRHWYFGHFHKDIQLDNKYTVLYDDIIKINLIL